MPLAIPKCFACKIKIQLHLLEKLTEHLAVLKRAQLNLSMSTICYYILDFFFNLTFKINVKIKQEKGIEVERI